MIISTKLTRFNYITNASVNQLYRLKKQWQVPTSRVCSMFNRIKKAYLLCLFIYIFDLCISQILEPKHIITAATNKTHDSRILLFCSIFSSQTVLLKVYYVGQRSELFILHNKTHRYTMSDKGESTLSFINEVVKNTDLINVFIVSLLKAVIYQTTACILKPIWFLKYASTEIMCAIPIACSDNTAHFICHLVATISSSVVRRPHLNKASPIEYNQEQNHHACQVDW